MYFFFFNDTATTEIYTLSLHDALPILRWIEILAAVGACLASLEVLGRARQLRPGGLWDWEVIKLRHPIYLTPPFSFLDRKSTRLNSSHANISYAVFCLKKKKHPT